MSDLVRCPKCKEMVPADQMTYRKRGTWKPALYPCKRCQRAKWNRRKRAEKTALIANYGGACVCCGESRMEFMSIDHINGGGKKHRLETGGGCSGHFYRWLRRQGYPKDGYRLLCHNCNQARGAYGYCPHEKEKLVAVPASDYVI